MKTLTIVLSIISAAFLIIFLIWFFTHAISRDKLLVQFGKSYFRLLLILMIALICIISSVMMWHQLSAGNLVETGKTLNELEIGFRQFIKIDELPKGNSTYDRIFSLVVMLIQILVFDGLIIASMVGWTERRTKQSKKGIVRYSIRELQGSLVSFFDHLYTYLREKKAGHPSALSNLKKRNHFAVVIGANEVAAAVIKNLLQSGEEKEQNLNYGHEEENQYVILQTNSDIESVRQMLKSHLTEQEIERVILYSAARESLDELRPLHVENASEIYILGESTENDGGENYHDSMNMRCLHIIAKLLDEHREKALAKGRKYERKVCKVLFEYQTTYSVFQFADISKQINQTMVFLPFNRYESWARKVLVDCTANEISDSRSNSKPIIYTPLDGYDGINYESDKHVHLVIIGMSKMGIALGIQALYQAHYPNYVRDQRLKTRITFIDSNAEQELAFFKGRYSMLFELMRHRCIDANSCDTSDLNSAYAWIDPMTNPDCQWKHLSAEGKNFLDTELEFIAGSVESEGVREYLRQISQDSNSKLTIAVCLPLAHQAIATSLYMPIEVYKNQNLQQILVYQMESADIVSNFEDPKVAKSSIRYNKLRPFGMVYGEYMDKRTRYLKAILVHGVYNMDSENCSVKQRNMGDISTYQDLISDWKWYDKKNHIMMTVALKWSNKFFVDLMYQKIRSIMPVNEQEAIGGYHNILFDRIYDEKQEINTLEKELNTYFKKNESHLAECEHNRWNIQQLLLGFSPANLEDDTRLREFVVNGAVDEEKKTEFKQIKEELKHSPDKIHPNICDFAHLDVIDPGAKGYDQKLNNEIPKILILVDGYNTRAHKDFKEK